MHACSRRFHLSLAIAVAAGLTAVAVQPAFAQSAAAGDAVERVDLLSFAQGAIPVGIGGAGATLGASFAHAVRIVDGSPTGFTVVEQAPQDADTEFVYELPALTTFDRLAVGEVLETPSPTATFTRVVEVHGSSSGPSEGFVLLGSATLTTHKARGLTTDLQVVSKQPVRWVKLRLVGGINVMRPLSSFEFSEIIGNGAQEIPEMATHFDGAWRTMGNTLGLEQEGPVVSGCYERTGRLNGTVTGNILRATGTTPENIPSAFVLSVAPDGSVRGVRSTNRGPFVFYAVDADPGGQGGNCGTPAPPALGCGSIIHGITFGFDSAEIRSDSAPVLAELYEGLRGDTSAAILIEGHTSSEGTEAYNLELSNRRAQAVVADLVARGLVKDRVSGAGVGESRPIASNADESGRALNRRVEVRCK